MKRIAICDDNELQRKMLEDLLWEYCRKNHQKVEFMEYTSGEELLVDVEEEECNAELIFLDIYMTGMNGIDTAKKLRGLHCDTEIVFLTGTSDYALEGYEVQAAGYLIKPVDRKKLEELLDHIFWEEQRKRIEVKCGKQYRYPYIGEILYIESSGHTAAIFLTDGSVIRTVEKLSTLKERIHDVNFLQCHQSYLVNMNYIADIQKEVILRNGKKIPVSARRRSETIETYHQFFETFNFAF